MYWNEKEEKKKKENNNLSFLRSHDLINNKKIEKIRKIYFI